MTECSKCKNRYSEDCKGKPYYEPREIKFCSLQFVWLIENIATLHEFIWVGGADVDIPRRKKPGGRGYFETPADFSWEVERRLEHCHLDGLMVYLHHAYEWDELQLSKYYGLRVDEVKLRMSLSPRIYRPRWQSQGTTSRRHHKHCTSRAQ